MMDWAKQAEEMAKTWTDMQRKVWDGWLEAMQGMTTPQPTAWERTVETWEKAFDSLLKAQGEWVKMWAEGIGGQENAPEDMARWASQVQEMTANWVAFQGELWKGWFGMARRFDPADMAGTPSRWTADAQNMMQQWQEQMAKTWETQLDWMKQWSGKAAE
jgi:hypothetical protein